MSNQILTTSSNLNLAGKISGDVTHFVLLCDATSKELTITLPDSYIVKNICVVIIKIDTGNNVLVKCNVAGQKINGQNTATLSSRGHILMLFACSKEGYWGLPFTITSATGSDVEL